MNLLFGRKFIVNFLFNYWLNLENYRHECVGQFFGIWTECHKKTTNTNLSEI
jgi:hypothetical protein